MAAILFIVIGIPVIVCVAAFTLIRRIRVKWDGTPAADFEQLKCTVCRGGVQAIFTSRNGGRHHSWGRIPDDLLLLNRRPDSEGGDKWGAPLASIRNCDCCQGKGYHLVAPDQKSSWLACPRPASEARHADQAG